MEISDYEKIVGCIRFYGAMPINKRLISHLSGVDVETVAQIGRDTGIFTEDPRIEIVSCNFSRRYGKITDFFLVYNKTPIELAKGTVTRLNKKYQELIMSGLELTLDNPPQIEYFSGEKRLDFSLGFPDLVEKKRQNDFEFVSSVKEDLLDIRRLLS